MPEEINEIVQPAPRKNKGGRPTKASKTMKSIAAEQEKKMTPAKMRQRIEELESEISSLKNDSGFCRMCGKIKPRTYFFMSTDPLVVTGITPICKQCAYDLACRKDAHGEYHTPTKESIILALRYLDKPFLNVVYNASVQESSKEILGGRQKNLWACYVKNVAMKNYAGLTFIDSDHLKPFSPIVKANTIDLDIVTNNKEKFNTQADFSQNKGDVVRLLGYDPFEKESLEDQPFLYSQLLGLLDSDENGNDDMMRVSAAVNIVRSLLQQSKTDDAIARLMTDYYTMRDNATQIKALQDNKLNLTRVINSLAAENCISLKNSRGTKKGENTWTGKIKKIKDLNLRDGEVNGFDLATCKGMQQVMDMSNASILKQLRLDESEYAEMVATQREMITKANEEVGRYKELNRILLRENIDLKDLLVENKLLLNRDIVDLNKIYSYFSDDEDRDLAAETMKMLEDSSKEKDEGGSDG